MSKQQHKIPHRLPTAREVARHLYGQEAALIAQRLELLRGNPDHTGEELNQLPGRTPVCALKSPSLLAAYCRREKLGMTDAQVLLATMKVCRYWLKDIDVDDDCPLTYDEARQLAKDMQTRMIYLHRINYVLHTLMLRVSDIVDDRGRLRFQVKKAWVRCEEAWNAYFSPSFWRLERAAWYVTVDHFGIYADAIMPSAEQVYVALRDRMIALGWTDVELKARTELALRMGRVCAVTFLQFFDEVHKEHGISFRRLFIGNDLTPMTERFAEFSASIGIPTARDEHGTLHVRGFESDHSPRVCWAWKRYIEDLRDMDKQDAAALKAISLNPEISERYRQDMEAAERAALQAEEEQKRRDMEEGFKQLEEKYKVTRL